MGRKAYGSIGHLPSSRLGPTDSCITEGQARIATEKVRDKFDVVIVQEKLDGSCVAAAKIGGKVVPLTRAGYHARTSPFEQHHLWADWVEENADRFDIVLQEGERLVGEWLAQAHGTLYSIGDWCECREPFIAFDLMKDAERVPYQIFKSRVYVSGFEIPWLLSVGDAISVADAMKFHERRNSGCDEPEGVVYRVERHGKVDFLCKWVRPDKVDGKYLPEVSGKEAVWNWRPEVAK